MFLAFSTRRTAFSLNLSFSLTLCFLLLSLLAFLIAFFPAAVDAFPLPGIRVFDRLHIVGKLILPFVGPGNVVGVCAAFGAVEVRHIVILVRPHAVEGGDPYPEGVLGAGMSGRYYHRGGRHRHPRRGAAGSAIS